MGRSQSASSIVNSVQFSDLDRHIIYRIEKRLKTTYVTYRRSRHPNYKLQGETTADMFLLVAVRLYKKTDDIEGYVYFCFEKLAPLYPFPSTLASQKLIDDFLTRGTRVQFEQVVDDIKWTLGVVSGRLRFGSSVREILEDAVEQYEYAARHPRECVDMMDPVVVFILASADRLSDLVQRIRPFAVAAIKSGSYEKTSIYEFVPVELRNVNQSVSVSAPSGRTTSNVAESERLSSGLSSSRPPDYVPSSSNTGTDRLGRSS